MDHILSFEPEPSHYARERAGEKLYLGSELNMSKLYREFLEKKELGPGDKKPLSMTSFRNIFKCYNLAFRKPRTDTCGRCDAFAVIIKYSNDADETAAAKRLREAHWDEAKLQYDCNFYDFNILHKNKNQKGMEDWPVPPIWRGDKY